MFKTIAAKIPKDKDLPDRAWTIEVRTKLLEGTFYDVLQYAYHTEAKDQQGTYVPLAERRPSVRSGLLRVVVDDSVAMLFDDDHFPTPKVGEDEDTARDQLLQLIKDLGLQEVMIDAATKGAVGSVCLHLRILKGSRGHRPFVSVMKTTFLTPIWDPNEPDQLLRVEERYKVKGGELKARGYTIADDMLDAMHWFARDWDATAETWFIPWPVSDKDGEKNKQPDKTPGRTVEHKLGFVPMVWIKNLPGGDEIDGATTLVPEAIDTVIQIDYQLSQAGRGLKYSSDPLLLIKEPVQTNGQFVRSASNAIVVDKDGDAKMLEIDGAAAEAVVNYFRALRELALEAMHGNRASPDKLATAQSGRAMELMNHALILLAGRLRITYGERGILSLLRMIARASEKIPITIGDQQNQKIVLKSQITLRWPRWYASTAQDRLVSAQAIATARGAGVMSKQTGVHALADDYDVEDVEEELKRIDADAEQSLEMQSRQQAPKGADA